jgi:phosphohistidine phosphatase
VAKTLLLIRHAKSSWEGDNIADFERPLNERGKRDAPDMAKRLVKQKQAIDLFVSSPAKRAKRTAEYFAREFNVDEDKILFKPRLYHAARLDFIETIQELNDRATQVAIFSHNPGITDFASSLTSTRIDDMPTCAIIAFKIMTDRWAEFEKAEKSFLFFDFPKSGKH